MHREALRTRRSTTALFTASVCTVLFAPACAERVPHSAYSLAAPAEEAEIVAVALAAMHTRIEGPQVLDPRTRCDDTPESWMRAFELFGDASGLGEPIWRAHLQENEVRTDLDTDALARLMPGLLLPRTEDELAALSEAGYIGPNPFTERFPGAQRLDVSRPVLTPDRRRALLYVWSTRGPLAGEGRIYVLERTDEGWSVAFEQGWGMA